MKLMKRLGLILLISILMFLIGGYIFSPTIRNMIRYNFADITDYKIFPNRPLQASANMVHYASKSNEQNINSIIPEAKGDFAKYVASNETVAFLVIENDTIKYENYFNDYDQKSIVTSFSMAKSVTSLLIGCALKDGLIKSVNDAVSTYIPEMKSNGFDSITIEHVLQMTSNIDFNESYINPFGEAARFYYGDGVEKYTTGLTLKRRPMHSFEYTSGNTQILGLILQRVLKNKTVTQYAQEKLWTPLGMEFDASWSMDNKEGMEKTFCCLNARAKDFAKIGSMMLHKGFWNGKQIVDSSWVATSTKPSYAKGGASNYQYQWWMPSANGDFMAQGILGQYIYVNPSKNLVIVRLGKDKGKVDWPTLFIEIAAKWK